MRERLVVVTALLAACAGAQGPSIPPPEPAGAPAQLAGFTFSDSMAYGENGGTAFRYAAPSGTRVDVYVYPIPPMAGPCRDACLDAAAQADVNVFVDNFAELVVAGRYDSMANTEITSRTVPSASWVDAGRVLRFRLLDDGTWYDSFYYLFAGRETYLKIRVSHPLGENRRSEVEPFVDAVLSQWPAPYSCRDLADEEGVLLSTTIAEPVDTVAQRISEAASELGYRFAYADAKQGRWRTAPQFAPPRGAENEDWHDGRTTGVELFVLTEQRGDSTVLQVAAHELCKPAGPPANVIEILSSLLFANAVTGIEEAR